MALAEFGIANFEKVTAVVTKSLMYRDGEIYRVDDLDVFTITLLKKLETRALFNFSNTE